MRMIAVVGVVLRLTTLNGHAATTAASCGPDETDHDGSGGRVYSATVTVDYTPTIDGNGQPSYRIDALNWVLLDLNYTVSWTDWLSAWFKVFTAELEVAWGVIDSEATDGLTLGAAVADLEYEISDLAENGVGVEWSSEDQQSYVSISVAGKTYEFYNQDGNNGSTNGVPIKTAHFVLPAPLYVSASDKQSLYVLYYADQRGISGDTTDHRNSSVCNALTLFPILPRSTTTTTLSPTSTTLLFPPSAVTGLHVTPLTSSAVLAWNAASGASYYDIAVSPGGAHYTTRSTSITITGLASNATYTFAVTAVGPGGTSAVAKITTTTLATYRAQVTSVAISGENGGIVDLRHLHPAQHAWVTVTATNVGTATWKNSGANPVRIGTSGPHDRGSLFASGNWISWTRVTTLNQASVAPGGTGTFAFVVTAPDSGDITSYNEAFNFVAEGKTWFETSDFAFSPKVIPIVGIASTPLGGGYWEVAADGGVFTFGNATFYGSEGSTPLVKPMVGMDVTPTGKGYWLVAADGGVFAKGDAQYFGGAANKPLNKPVVGMARTPSGKGYWLAAADGGVFNYGDAPFLGSLANTALNKPIVGIAAGRTGGFWLVGADGGVFTFGTKFYGSMGNKTLNKPVVGMARTATGLGYWLAGADGGIFSFGDAKFLGSLANTPRDTVIAGITALPNGYELIGTGGPAKTGAATFPFTTAGAPTANFVNGTGCGHTVPSSYGPLAHCSNVSGTTTQHTIVSVLCTSSISGASATIGTPSMFVGPSISNDGSGTFEFFGGPQVSTALGPTSYGEQRWNAGAYGPLVRWGNFNFSTNRFFPDGGWMADAGDVLCQSITPQ